MQQHGLLDGCVRTILYGHSYGALIAYEVTRAIEARCGDRIVSHLVVSSLECPHGVEMRYKDISVRKHLFSDAALMKSLTRLGGAVEWL
jgi:surfactin synthase thioesterase subunit